MVVTLRQNFKILSIALMIVGLCGCTPQVRPGVLHGPSRVLQPSDYKVVLKTWTRSAKIYQGLDSQMFVTATFHSPEFRRVFALAFPEIYGHGGNITRRELVDLTHDIEQYLTFFVSAYTADRKWNDLAKPDSIWRLSLEGEDGVSVSPTEIIPVKIDANLQAVYPYIDRFDKAYLVRFKLADPMNRLVVKSSSDHFNLKVVSALGKANLRWALEPMTVDLGEVEQPQKSGQLSKVPNARLP
jgi:hypothetical protein